MRLLKVTSFQPVADYLTRTISGNLKSGENVLWLLSGGSYIQAEVETANQLSGIDLASLTVSLVDERYGPSGHRDSNWQKLIDAGFNLPGANLVPILRDKDFTATLEDYKHFIENTFRSSAFKMACVGVGADGHTLGVLPNSSAAGDVGMVVGYDGGDHQRISLSLTSLSHFNEVVVYMTGSAKHQVLDQLKSENLNWNQQPAQALKTAQSLLVYNDYIGEPE